MNVYAHTLLKRLEQQPCLYRSAVERGERNVYSTCQSTMSCTPVCSYRTDSQGHLPDTLQKTQNVNVREISRKVQEYF